MLLLLAICFGVSAFYSFNTYFNSLYEGKEERRVEARAVPAFRWKSRPCSTRRSPTIGRSGWMRSGPWRERAAISPI
jgi:hypothetical protein